MFPAHPPTSSQERARQQRRAFLKLVSVGFVSALTGGRLWYRLSHRASPPGAFPPRNVLSPTPRPAEATLRLPDQPPPPAPPEQAPARTASRRLDPRKVEDPERSFGDDYLLDFTRHETLASLAYRLERARDVVGFGNFNLLSFDDLLSFSRNYSRIGEFPRREMELMEELFYDDATRYGFFGERVLREITHVVAAREAVAIEGTGHFLFRGAPFDQYRRIRRDLGDSVILTSGVRGVVKQMQLFVSKIHRCEGNLSRASRSIAPPGFSYHSAGDFDIGKVGFGLRNFTPSFADTREFKRMIRLGYVRIRYTKGNPFGVRYEPWHIRMV